MQNIISMQKEVNAMAWDFRILDAIQTKRTKLLDKLMPLASDSVAVWYVLAFVMLWHSSTRAAGVLLGCALGITALMCNLVLKHLFQRTRPCDVNPNVQMLVARPKDYSFPSCHTAASFAAAWALYMAGVPMFGLAFLLASMIAFSRMYLYVHYPSDVLIGMGCGYLCAILARALAASSFFLTIGL